MNDAAHSSPGKISGTNERRIILLLGLLAAVHVSIFSAAFPFFNNVDEQAHFDLAVRYSQGAPPDSLTNVCSEALPYIVIFSSSEYLWTPESRHGEKFAPPPWTLPPEQMARDLAPRQKFWRDTVINYEDSQPPLYYTIAGVWWRLSRSLGFHDGTLLYQMRFLNIFFMAALVWLGWSAAKIIFPENKFFRVALPALVAVLPQTAFYSINDDILSPLCFGVAFLYLIKLLRTENPGVRLGIFTGLWLAATFLTKISNLPLLAISALVILFKAAQLARAGKLRAALPSLLALVLCAGLPMAAWLAWCKHAFGDFSGTAAKIQFLGWTHKPFADWWHHPIFTLHGLWTFLSTLVATFWQGELMWHRQPLALPWVDLTYAAASIILTGIALLNLLRQSKDTTAMQRQALWLGFWCFAAAVAFLGFLSIIYDFHDCFYPSREHPYFTSGRLMLGALIPFLLLFTFGLDQALEKFGDAAKFSVLAAIMLFMLVVETIIDWPVFSNPYNWFHL